MSVESRLTDVEEALRLLRDADRLQGRRVSATAPTDSYYLGWNGATKKWEPKGLVLIVKPSSESVNNSAALQNDDDLVFPVAANETWIFDLCIFFESDTTPDIKFAFTIPAGATLSWGISEDTGGGTQTPVYRRRTASDDAQVAAALGFGTGIPAHIMGTIANGATPGNLQLRWAQNTADAANPTNVLANSWLRAFLV